MNTRKPRVLIVEDDVQIRLLPGLILEEAGYMSAPLQMVSQRLRRCGLRTQ
jgi:hypothetical protein